MFLYLRAFVHYVDYGLFFFQSVIKISNKYCLIFLEKILKIDDE